MSNYELIPPSGGFRKLRSYRYAQVVYHGTVLFCNKFIDKKSRTHDQMVQAARSGVQNIAEGSLASATSKKTEIKLTGVARASLGELLLDYEDYLRQNNLHRWDKADPEAISTPVFANTLICLINQVSYLLWQQMKSQEKDFLEHGAFTERMYNIKKTGGTSHDFLDCMRSCFFRIIRMCDL
jgi:restriction system protein